MRFAIDGLVLKEMETGENDKLLLILTATKGKIWVKAKGGRSIKSGKSALCRAFTYAEFELYEKHNILWLSGGSPSVTFFAYRTDLEEYALAAYVCEICEEITGEEEDAELVLRATLNTFYAIEKKLAPLPIIKASYEIFASCVSGFTPELYHCKECSCDPAAKNGEKLFLDVMNGAVVCEECANQIQGADGDTDKFETKKILLPLDSSALLAFRYCSEAQVSRLFNFSVTDKKSLQRFSRAAETYLLNHLERGFNTLSFYKSIKD